jgi:hypothetical protein
MMPEIGSDHDRKDGRMLMSPTQHPGRFAADAPFEQLKHLVDLSAHEPTVVV